MRDYLVRWEIDVFDAESPEDAARMALESIKDLTNETHVFEVTATNGDGNVKTTYTVDLDPIES